MQIREYREDDLGALRAIHAAQTFDYALPDLHNPLFVTRLVLTEKEAACDRTGTACRAPTEEGSVIPPDCYSDKEPAHGKILGAALLRLTAEAYLLLDPRAGTPRQRWQWLLALHEAARRDAWQRGLEDVHAWLPPPIARQFGRRLERLGWIRDDAWTPYCRYIEP